MPIKNYSSTCYVGIRRIENAILHVRYRSSYMITTEEHGKALNRQKPLLFYSKSCLPSVLLTFLKLEKANMKIQFGSSSFFLIPCA